MLKWNFVGFFFSGRNINAIARQSDHFSVVNKLQKKTKKNKSDIKFTIGYVFPWLYNLILVLGQGLSQAEIRVLAEIVSLYVDTSYEQIALLLRWVRKKPLDFWVWFYWLISKRKIAIKTNKHRLCGLICGYFTFLLYAVAVPLFANDHVVKCIISNIVVVQSNIKRL